MTARYTVIQCVPDPITDERINIGVVAWDDNQIFCHFLSDWRRVRSFAGFDLGFIRQFTKKLQLVTSPQLRLALEQKDGFDTRELEKIIGTWQHSIQFTEPRGSIKDAQALLADVAPTFLRETAVAPRTIPRGRRIAASLAVKHMFEAVQQRIADRVDELVKTDAQLGGSREQHTFDVVLANGKPLAAVKALSFEGTIDARHEIAVEATAWLLEDVRKKHRNLPLAIFALPPIGESAAYERAKALFPRLKGELVLENKMPQWARKQARLVANQLS